MNPISQLQFETGLNC